MVVIPGLSPLLEAAGKHISSWDDSGSRFGGGRRQRRSVGGLPLLHL
jgi:hypothetical protein